MGIDDQYHAMVPMVQEAGYAPGLVWTGAESLVPTRI